MLARPALLALLLVVPAPLAAQVLRGELRGDTDSLPVAGALVIVTDSRGAVARTASNESGRFAVRLSASGPVAVRVLRIGQAPFETQADAGPQGATLTAWLPTRPILLEAITAASARRQCGIVLDSGVFGRLLGEARTALQLAEVMRAQHQATFAVETWQRRITRNGRTLDSTGARSRDRGWPIRSAPPESLRTWGFVRDEPDGSGHLATTYYGPDASVLFDYGFLASRCFLIAPAVDGVLTISFAPARRGDLVDIAGTVSFDERTLGLREITWRWVGLPPWVPDEGPGGFVRFTRLANGAWLASEWSLRAPVPRYGRGTAVPVFAELLEIGGRASVTP